MSVHCFCVGRLAFPLSPVEGLSWKFPGGQAPNVPRHECTVPGLAKWLSPCLQRMHFPGSPLAGGLSWKFPRGTGSKCGQAPVHCSWVGRVACPPVSSGLRFSLASIVTHWVSPRLNDMAGAATGKGCDSPFLSPRPDPGCLRLSLASIATCWVSPSVGGVAAAVAGKGCCPLFIPQRPDQDHDLSSGFVECKGDPRP
ncbi:hypothetical protein XELAEV_18029157mg [Xenopus laevis]|uniref:Uncharacterized protein n=1 Tax=Xenopus laevis TaxID=8355 RepID=A0A974CQU8_XENLA|nr:hypothetical protein XELAEV_18029157mg [Xenopus laevis]